MIYKLLVVDKTGVISKRIEGIFTRFVMDYLVFRISDLEETEFIGKKERIDVIIVNGDDYVESLSKEKLRSFKEKIVPSPKLLLLLEPNLMNTLPAVEREVHEVMDSKGFRTLQILHAVDRLAYERARERYERTEAELKKKKGEFDTNLQAIREMREGLRQRAEQEENGDGDLSA